MKTSGRVWGMLSVLLAVVVGCGPRIAPAELGEISQTLPALPGTSEPYPLPELEDSEDAETSPSDTPAENEPKTPVSSAESP